MDADIYWMQHAINLSKKAALQGEVPVGAVLVYEDKSIGEGWNQPISTTDPTAHAEIMALRAGANAINNYRLLNTTLYVTLEPCLMCAGALVHARIKRLVFGAYDTKAGGVVSQAKTLEHNFLNHKVAHTAGVLSESCGSILSEFFKHRRFQSVIAVKVT